MNQHNLISIVPSISEMASDSVKDKKCREVIAKIHKLIGKLKEMFNKSNLDKQKRNKKYRGYLQQLEDSIVPSEISFESILKVELHLTELEKKIKSYTEEKEIRLCGARRFNKPDSTVIQEIDLTYDDDDEDGDKIQERSNSPSILQPDSTVCESELRMAKHIQDGNSPLLDGENVVSSSVSHHSGRILTQKKPNTPIIDIEDLCKNLPQTNNYMTNLSHRTSTASPQDVITSDIPRNADDSSIDGSAKKLKNDPVLRIFELAKQNTSGSTNTDYSLTDMDIESPSSVSAVPISEDHERTKADVAEKVTRLIKKLPDADREIFLKEGVNNFQELVEKKSRSSLPSLNCNNDSISNTLKYHQTAVPRLSELLLEQMDSPVNTTQSTIQSETSRSSQSVASNETSKIPPVMPRLPILEKSFPFKDERTSTQTVLPNQTAGIPQPVPKPDMFNKSHSREPAVKDTKIPQQSNVISRTPQVVPRPNISNKSSPNGQGTRTTLLSQPTPKTAIPPRFPVRPPLTNMKPTICNQSPRNSSFKQMTKKESSPESSVDFKKKISGRSAPLPLPNFSDPRKNDLRSKFNQEIGVVHKVGDSQKICPSLKQLKNDKRPLENSSPHVSCNISSPVNSTLPSHLNDSFLRRPQSQISNDPRSLPKHNNPNLVQKKVFNRKPPPPSILSCKKNSVNINSPSRRRSSENNSRNNANSPEINIPQNKQSTNFLSPLADIYSAPLPTARTGLGYGKQRPKFKIPKINNVGESGPEEKKEPSETMMFTKVKPGAESEEDNKSTSNQNNPKQVEILEQLEKSEKCNEKITDALPQRIVPLKPTISKTSTSILKKSLPENFKPNNDLEKNKDKRLKNPPENSVDKLEEADLFETNLKIIESDVQNKSKKNSTLEEGMRSKSNEVEDEKNETSKVKSFTKNNALPQPKPFCIILSDLETSRFDKKVIKRSSINEESSMRRGSEKVMNSTFEKEEEDTNESILRPKKVNKKRRTKQKLSKLKSSSSDETDSELSSLQPVAKTVKPRILSSSDESSAEVEVHQATNPMLGSESDTALSKPLKKICEISLSGSSSSVDHTSTTLLQATTTSLDEVRPSCFDDCSCASEIMCTISLEENPEIISVDVDDSNDTIPIPNLPTSSHRLTPNEDTMNYHLDEPEKDDIEQRTRSSESATAHSRRLLQNCKACPQLREFREKFDNIDADEPNWLFLFMASLTSKDYVSTVHGIIQQTDKEIRDEIDEPIVNINNSVNQSKNLEDESASNISYIEPPSEMQDDGADESIIPATKSASKVKCGVAKKRVKSASKLVSKVKLTTAKPTQRRHYSRELALLHADIRKMKRTKKNNIFDAIGERKCRKQPINYQERPLRLCDPSTPKTITLPSEDFEVPSDTDSLLLERKSQGRRSASTDIVSDDSSCSNQNIHSRQNQTVSNRRRGKPEKKNIQSQWVINTSNEAPKYKPGPRCMKKKLYGEEAVKEYELNQLGLKQLSVRLTKIPVTDIDEENVENAFMDEEEIENILLDTKIKKNRTAEDSELDQSFVNSEKAINDVDTVAKTRRRRKKKKKKKRKKDTADQHLEKIMKEVENEARRKSSSNYNPPLENKENSPPHKETEVEENLHNEQINKKIANLPECNAFKEDTHYAQILSIAIEWQQSKLFYKCSGPECSYSTNNAKMFANHVNVLHKNVVWKGDCPICCDTVLMGGQADLIDALSHLMNQHLKMIEAEIINVDLSDEENQSFEPIKDELRNKGSVPQVPENSCEDIMIDLVDDEAESLVDAEADRAMPISVISSKPSSDASLEESSVTEFSTPRLRVRRLSGDRLSGDVLPGADSEELPSNTTVEPASTLNNDSGRFSLCVIKDVKTKQGGEIPVDQSHIESTVVTDETDNPSSEKQQTYDKNIPPKILLTNSAHSESSVIKLYKCGGTTWNNPETCKFSSDVSSDFFQHLKRCHVANKKKKVVAKKFLKCIYCGEQNSDAEKMVQHIENVHRICQFQCPYCEYRACRPVYLKWHRDLEHQFYEEKILVPELKDNVSEVRERSQSPLWSKPYAEIILPYCCTLSCEYSTYSEAEFIQHSRTHHSEVVNWRCSQCDHVCLDLKKLMTHYKSFHGMAMYQCKYCKYGTLNRPAMTVHLAKSHPHLYPSVLVRKPSSSGDDNSWVSRIMDQDLDEPFSNFKLSLKLVKTSSLCLGADVSTTNPFKPEVAPMSIAEETEAAVSAITSPKNDTPAVLSDQNESRRASSGGAISLYSSDDDTCDRLVINEDDCEDFDSTIAERLRPIRRSSAEIPSVSRNRPSKDITGLEGSALYKCGMAGCSIAVDDYKSYEDHLKICDNARNSASYQCPHCDYKVQSGPKFLSHLLLHGPLRYYCSLCGLKHQDSRKVIEHMRSSAHRVHGEAEIVPIIPLKKDKYKDHFVIKFDPDKIVRSRGSKVPAEGMRYARTPQLSPKSSSTISSEQTRQITMVNSWEEVEKYLPMQTFRDFVICGICQFKNKVRSNLLNHMKLHASGGLTTSENIVNPVPRIGKNNIDLMFNKMSNHAGYATKNDNKGVVKTQDELSDNSDVLKKKVPIPKYVPIMRRFVCNAPDCQYLSHDVCGLKNHYNNLHKDLTQFKCPHCQTIVAISKINTHLRYHGDKLFKCGCCDYVHFQRKVIEKHQQDQHNNQTYNIVVVREKPLTESEHSDHDSLISHEGTIQGFEHGIKKLPKCGWKCNLCGERMSDEVLMRAHCQTKHSILCKYKCCLCDFGTFQKGEIDEHSKSNHDGSSKIFLPIYEEVNKMGDEGPGSMADQYKLNSSESNTVLCNQKRGAKFDNLTPSASCASSDSESSRWVNIFPVMDESNEMMVEPYADRTFRCPFCSTFQTSSLQEMRFHIYTEKNYDRYVCTACATTGVSRFELEPHVLSHPPKKESYIRKLTADTTLEVKVKQALLYQFKKLNPNSSIDSAPTFDSDDDYIPLAESNHLLTDSYNHDAKIHEVIKNTSSTKRCKKQKTKVIPSSAFVCSMCPKYFSSSWGLRVHQNVHKKKVNTSPSLKKRSNEELFAKDNLLTSKTTVPIEGRGLWSQENSSTSNEEIDHPPRAKRSRLSPSMDDLSTLLPDEQGHDKSEFLEINDLAEHVNEINGSYPCLFCDKILVGKREISEHLQASLKLQQDNQFNYECITSENKAVKMVCSFCSSYSLSGVSWTHYELITCHIKNSHPSQQKDDVIVQIDAFSARLLTDVEIAYLKSIETLSVSSTKKTRTKRRNVAVKSTARPTGNSPPCKLMFLDGSAITTLPAEYAECSSIFKASDGSITGILATPFLLPKTNVNDLDSSTSVRPELEKNLGTSTLLPSTEEIIISDDDSPSIPIDGKLD